VQRLPLQEAKSISPTLARVCVTKTGKSKWIGTPAAYLHGHSPSPLGKRISKGKSSLKIVRIGLALTLLACFVSSSYAIHDPDAYSSHPLNHHAAEQILAVPEVVEDATSPADLAWMLMASALVLFMTAPGLAMFYSGLVRKKNVIGVMMQCLFLMGLMSVIWALWGYSLSFGKGGPFIGNFDHLFLNGLEMKNGELPGGAVPDLVFMIFQGMFFVITPALICGAFAERMKFGAMVLFMIGWGTLVYCPLCHMVWGEGWLFFGGENTLLGGALDLPGERSCISAREFRHWSVPWCWENASVLAPRRCGRII